MSPDELGPARITQPRDTSSIRVDDSFGLHDFSLKHHLAEAFHNTVCLVQRFHRISDNNLAKACEAGFNASLQSVSAVSSAPSEIYLNARSGMS